MTEYDRVSALPVVNDVRVERQRIVRRLFAEEFSEFFEKRIDGKTGGRILASAVADQMNGEKPE